MVALTQCHRAIAEETTGLQFNDKKHDKETQPGIAAIFFPVVRVLRGSSSDASVRCVCTIE